MYVDRKKRPEEWWLFENEFEAACQIIIERYRAMSLEILIDTPRALDLLFAWRQAGDDEGPSKFIDEVSRSDQALIDILSVFVTSVYNSDKGRYVVIKSEYIDAFLDYESVKKRLAEIVASGSIEIRDRAKELIGLMPMQ